MWAEVNQDRDAYSCAYGNRNRSWKFEFKGRERRRELGVEASLTPVWFELHLAENKIRDNKEGDNVEKADTKSHLVAVRKAMEMANCVEEISVLSLPIIRPYASAPVRSKPRRHTVIDRDRCRCKELEPSPRVGAY